jgi:predicted heme/steroid binding protein
MKTFSRQELKLYNGKENKKIYFAFNGKVYDATNSFLWKEYKYMAMRFAGNDLT